MDIGIPDFPCASQSLRCNHCFDETAGADREEPPQAQMKCPDGQILIPIQAPELAYTKELPPQGHLSGLLDQDLLSVHLRDYEDTFH